MAVGRFLSHGLDWTRFEGSAPALTFARRDLQTVTEALAYVSRRQVAVQAGGCLGVFPKYLAQSFGAVYTFEPMLESYRKLLANAPETNIVARCAALGYDRTPVAMTQRRRTKTHAPAHEGIAHVSGVGDVPVARIDDLALACCDFLCLDLEGYEYEALKGATDTLAGCRPVVMVEINEHITHYGQRPEDVRALLFGAGYRFVFRRHSDEVYVPGERAE